MFPSFAYISFVFETCNYKKVDISTKSHLHTRQRPKNKDVGPSPLARQHNIVSFGGHSFSSYYSVTPITKQYVEVLKIHVLFLLVIRGLKTRLIPHIVLLTRNGTTTGTDNFLNTST
jgi:hypothetical protein